MVTGLYCSNNQQSNFFFLYIWFSSGKLNLTFGMQILSKTHSWDFVYTYTNIYIYIYVLIYTKYSYKCAYFGDISAYFWYFLYIYAYIAIFIHIHSLQRGIYVCIYISVHNRYVNCIHMEIFRGFGHMHSWK